MICIKPPLKKKKSLTEHTKTVPRKTPLIMSGEAGSKTDMKRPVELEDF